MDNDAQMDIAIAAGAISSPVWLHSLNEWVTLAAGIGGIILLIIRIKKNLKAK